MGQDNFYLELQDHGIPEQTAGEPGACCACTRRRASPWSCTNDAHYLRREDAESHDVLLCIQTGKTVDDENRMRYEPQNFYLRSDGGDARRCLPGIPRRVENTQRIADRCQFGLHLRQVSPAGVPAAAGATTAPTYLRELC